MKTSVAFPAALALAAIALAGCSVMARAPMTPPLQWSLPAKRILLLEPQVTLWENPLTGDKQRRDDWSDSAKGEIVKQLQSAFMSRKIDVVLAIEPASEQVLYDFSSCAESGGQVCGKLRDEYQADYVIRISVSDTYDSTGNAAAKAVGGAAQLVGIGLLSLVAGPVLSCAQFPDNPACFGYGGRTSRNNNTSISMFDLRSGAGAWSKNVDAGDWRSDAPARSAAQKVLTAFPF